MGFIVVWDTCTRPAYYADLHKVLASPAGLTVRYDYKRKRFDQKSGQIIADLATIEHRSSSAVIDVVIFYGEVADYTKGAEDPSGDSVVSEMVPYRLGQIVSSRVLTGSDDSQNDKLVYDIELQGYPDVVEFGRRAAHFREQVGNRRPFGVWHTYFEDDDLRTALIPKTQEESRQNWGRVVEKLQKLQFDDDSFWCLEGPYDADQQPLETNVRIVTYPSGLTKSILTVEDQKDILFSVFNTEPVSEATAKRKPRTIRVSAAGAVTVDRTGIGLRPYSIDQLHVRGTSSSYWKGDLGSLQLKTEADDTESAFPVGPHLELTFEISRKKIRVMWGLASGIAAVVGFTVLTKIQIFGDVVKPKELQGWNLAVMLGVAGLSSLLLVLSAILLRRDIKFK